MKNVLQYTFISFTLAIINISTIVSQEKEPPKKEKVTVSQQQALTARNEQFKNAQEIAAPLFEPVIAGTPPKPNPFPTTSINKKAIDATFGAQGIDINQDQLRHIKICFFYLEYITKLELAAKIVALARNKNVDVLSVLEKNSWKGVIAELGNWKTVQAELDAIEPAKNDWNIVRGSVEVATWKDVENTDFWKTIVITSADITQSAFWQNYAKYNVIKAFDQDESLLGSIYNVETRIFMYIPDIEVAYYNQDFTYLRNSSEYFRLTMILNDIVRNRFIDQIKDWKQYSDKKTNNTDLVALYEATKAFKNGPFYKLASIADQNFSTVVDQAAAQDFHIKEVFGDQKPGPLATEELTCLAMIKNIQAQLHYLFDSKHIEKTMKVLGDHGIEKPIPNILSYETADHLYLEDLALTIDTFSKSTQKNDKDDTVITQALSQALNKKVDALLTNAQHDEDTDELVEIQGLSSWFSKNWHKFKDKLKHSWGNVKKTAKKTWKDVKKLGGDIEKLGKDVVKGVEDEAKVALQATAAFGALISGNPKDAGKLIQNAVKLQQKVKADIEKANKDVQGVVSDTAKAAKDAGTIMASAVGDVVGLIDSRLGKDVEKEWEAATAVLVDIYAQMTAGLVVQFGAMIELTADAAAVAANVVTKTVVDLAKGNFSQLGKDVLGGIEDMVADVATTLWSSITFIGKFFLAELKDAVKFVGAMVAFLTDFVVDTLSFAIRTLGTLEDSLGFKDEADAINNIAGELEAHRRTIAAAITTALLVGSVIATDGAALPLIAMTVGPQVFQVYGSFQKDQQEEAAKKEQKKFLDDYKRFVDNNEIIAANAQKVWSEELSQKYRSQVANEERELGFYQNFLNQFFKSTEQQMSFYLGTKLAPRLTPDKTYDLRPADAGYLYGLKTGEDDFAGALDLNPSQGFSLYNKGRDLFSQEIAVYPALSMQLEQDQTLTSPTMHKFWFNQKETFPLNKETDGVEIRFQVIYALNMFAIGLYYGGQPVDVENIVKTKQTRVDTAHLAKMLVYHKQEKNKPAGLGLYEHEGEGWFKQQPRGPIFQMGTWYHMKMQLNSTTLQTKVWKEGDQEPAWQSFTVKPTDKKTVGVIFSGASIEYELVKPQIPIKRTKLRMPAAWKTEKEREQYRQKQMQFLDQPTVGPFKLKSVGKTQLLKWQFIYTTEATKQKEKNDYVALARNVGGRITDVGASPMKIVGGKPLKNSADVAVVSLVSGSAHDVDGKQIATCANALNAFLQKHGPLADDLTKLLKTSNQSYLKAQLGPYKFGSIDLSATSLADLQKGVFVYRAISPEKKLQKNDKPVEDAQGNPLYDYFAVLNQAGDSTAYSSSVQTIRSLVTGNEYGRQSTRPTDSGYPHGSQALTNGILTAPAPKALAQKIIASAKFYDALVTKPSTGGSSIQPIDDKDISDPTGPHTVVPTDTGKSTKIDPALKSLEQRRKEAGGHDNGDDLSGWGG